MRDGGDPGGRRPGPRGIPAGAADAGGPRDFAPGEVRETAALTPKGKLLFVARLVGPAGTAPAPPAAGPCARGGARAPAQVRGLSEGHGRRTAPTDMVAARPLRAAAAALTPRRGRAAAAAARGVRRGMARCDRGRSEPMPRAALARDGLRRDRTRRPPRSCAWKRAGRGSGLDIDGVEPAGRGGPRRRHLGDEGVLRRPGDRGAAAHLRPREPPARRIPVPRGPRRDGHSALASGGRKGSTERHAARPGASRASRDLSPLRARSASGSPFHDVAAGRPARFGRPDPARGAVVSATCRSRDARRHRPADGWRVHLALARRPDGIRPLPDLREARPGDDPADGARGRARRRGLAPARTVPAALRAASAIAPPDRKRILLYALLGVSFNQVLFILGLSLTTAINTTILTATIPGLHARASRCSSGASASRRAPRPRSSSRRRSPPAAEGRELRLAERVLPRRPAAPRQRHLLLAFYLVLSRPILARYRVLTVVSGVFAYGTLPIVARGAARAARFSPARVTPVGWASLAGGRPSSARSFRTSGIPGPSPGRTPRASPSTSSSSR